MAAGRIIKEVRGRAVPMPGDDIDTDRIIPARFMKCVTFEELGPYAFYDERFHADGSKKAHPFNDERYRGASLLVVGKNFGCGSSREHAPQSLMRFGIKALIGESFAEIFSDNCTTLGIPVVMAERSDCDNLMMFVKEDPACEVEVDLTMKTVSYGDFSFQLKVKESSRKALLSGRWDSTSYLLDQTAKIREVAGRLPYLNGY